jgi:hypothetical protein
VKKELFRLAVAIGQAMISLGDGEVIGVVAKVVAATMSASEAIYVQQYL